MRKSWLITCFVNFFLAASMGALLRYTYLHSIAVNYAFLLHGHSHTAMLGWVYLLLYAFIFHYFIPKTPALAIKYNRLFWITELSIVGMVISFPLQGYAVFSIFFSALHTLCAYCFCYGAWKDQEIQRPMVKRLLATALFFMLFSTLGVWCLGPIIAMLGKSSAWYQIAIQFFIHFQFNGWFLFAILALLFKQMEVAKVTLNRRLFSWFYYSLLMATFFIFALSVSWYVSLSLLHAINQVGVVLQLISFIFFMKLLLPRVSRFIHSRQPVAKLLYQLSFLMFLLKVGIQSLTFFPEIARLPTAIRNFAIGFIHLSMLGLVSGFLFAFCMELRYFRMNTRATKIGLLLFGIGFLLTELLLFVQGAFFYLGIVMIPSYYSMLFNASLGLPLGLLILISRLSYNN